GDAVDRADGRDLRRGAAEEDLVGDVQHLAWDHLLHYLDAQFARDSNDRVTSDARQHRIAQRCGQQGVILYQEDVLARAFAHVAVHVQRDTFDVSIGDGFHLDELR